MTYFQPSPLHGSGWKCHCFSLKLRWILFSRDKTDANILFNQKVIFLYWSVDEDRSRKYFFHLLYYIPSFNNGWFTSISFDLHQIILPPSCYFPLPSSFFLCHQNQQKCIKRTLLINFDVRSYMFVATYGDLSFWSYIKPNCW